MANPGIERIRRPLRAVGELLAASVLAFRNDRARRLSAGLAYYAVFALVPSFMTSVFIAATLVGEEAAEGTFNEGIADVVGQDLALQLETAISSAWASASTSQFVIVGMVVAAYTASILFVAWRDTLELIWDVPYVAGVKTTILKRVYGMLIPVVMGIVLAALVVIQAVFALFKDQSRFAIIDATLRVAGSLVPAVLAVAALSCLFRYTTRATRPPWRHVVPGALVSWFGVAVLSWGFGIYLQVIGTTSFAGAASSVVVGLVLLYYGAQILLFGGEVVRCSTELNPAMSWPVDESNRAA